MLTVGAASAATKAQKKEQQDQKQSRLKHAPTSKKKGDY